MDELYEDEDYLLGLTNQSNSSTPDGAGGLDDVAYSQNSDTGTANWVSFAAAVGLWFFAALMIKTCAFFICLGKNKILPERGFEHAVSEARKEANSSQNTAYTASSSDSSATCTFQSYDGDFYVKYEDHAQGSARRRRITRSGFVKIQLKNNWTTGYDISGMVADADGYATITDGHVSYNGQGWWVQEVLGEGEERSGLRVFSKGKFDFAVNCFSGSWVSNLGTHGDYLKFEGNAVSATPTPSMDIPVAIAMPKQALLLSAEDDSV